jgi:CBS domain-containing protein
VSIMRDQFTTDSGSYISPRLEHARVGDAMRHGVLSCPPDASLRAAARTMTLHHIHTVVLSDPADGALLGVVSDGALLAALLDPAGRHGTLEEIADRDDLVTLSSDQLLKEAVREMGAKGADHAVVRDARSGRPTGMLSTLDVLGVLAWGEA